MLEGYLHEKNNIKLDLWQLWLKKKEKNEIEIVFKTLYIYNKEA